MDNPIPIAPKRPKNITTHGEIRIDPWFWIRDVNDPETMEYLKAENAYTEAIMAPEEELQERLYQEMRGRIKEDDSTVPEKEGDYYYYTRFEEGQQYPIHCRKHLSLVGPEEVLIDVNELAKDLDYCRVGNWENSPDHKWLAYSIDTDGSERYTIVIKNLESGELLDEAIPGSYYSLEWANDSQTIYYDVLDEMVYEETDPRFFVGVMKSASKRFIFVTSAGNNMSEWHFIEANVPESKLTLVQPRRENFEYDVDHHGERFLIRNNGDGARDFKVSETPVSAPGSDNWKDFVPHLLGRPIAGFGVSQDYFFLYYRANGLPQVQITDLSKGVTHDLSLDDEDYSVRLQGSREWDSPVLRFSYASLTTPATVYDYDMGTRHSGRDPDPHIYSLC